MSFPNDPIQHVVVLMLENRSFDHMLGDLARLEPGRGINGVNPKKPGSNPYPNGAPITQQANARAALPPKFDPKHELRNVVHQLGSLTTPRMDGFVDDAKAAFGTASRDTIAQVMAYFPAEADLKKDPLPALRGLARHFTVCDNWYSSVPGPTWPNRFFALCGTAAGHVKMPEKLSDIGLLFKAYNMPTIFDRVRQAGRSCRVFHDGISLSMMLRQTWNMTDIYADMDEFEALAKGPSANFPDFSFIEPKYFSLFSKTQNDQHPPHDLRRGDQLIAHVYNQLRANTQLWDRTLLVVLYDEHGGFYDHAPPPATVAPDGLVGDVDAFAFDRLGVRVPALLVSKHVAAGGVDHTVYDHTSLLAYLCRKWDMPALGARCAQASSFEAAVVANINPNAPLSLPVVTVRTTRALEPQALAPNENQRALALMVDFVQSELGLVARGAVTRGLEDPSHPAPIAGEQIERRAQQALAHIKSLGEQAPAAPEPAPVIKRTGAAKTPRKQTAKAVAIRPLKVFMVHGIGHRDDPAKPEWKQRWMDAFRQSARGASYAHVDTIEFEFASFDSVFEAFPLDRFTIARGLLILAKGAMGPEPSFGATRELTQRGIKDRLRWTAGMLIQWIESEALRQALNHTLLAQMRAFDGDMVCAHSLGALICYDAFRQEIAKGQASQFDGKNLLTFGAQIAHPAVQSVFGGRIAPLVDPAGRGFERWYHLFNPRDKMFTRPLPGGDARTQSLLAPFDIEGDVLNHKGDRYLGHEVTASVVLSAVLPQPSTAGQGLRAMAAPAIIANRGARRRALLVGINDYPDPSMRLNGCVNDVYLMSSVLQECGFAADDIRLLTDRRATRAGLLERMDWLADGVQAGDERVLFYSGHGAQMPVYGGNGEPDKMCEALAPVDFDWSPEHAFTDKEFQSYYSHLPYDSQFLGIFDCCHAGGLTRGGQRVRGIDPPDDVRHRALRWSPQRQMWVPRDFAEVAGRTARAFELHTSGPAQKPPLNQSRSGLGECVDLRLNSADEFADARKRYGHSGPYMPLLMFAAGQSELAAEYEHGSVSYGAFTFALAKQMRAAKRAPSFERLVSGVRTELTELGYQQTPTLSGPTIKTQSSVPIFRWRG